MKKYLLFMLFIAALHCFAQEEPIKAVVTFDPLTEEQVNAIKAKIGLNSTMTVDNYYITNVILPLVHQHELKLHRLVLEYRRGAADFDFVLNNIHLLEEKDLQELTVKLKLVKEKLKK